MAEKLTLETLTDQAAKERIAAATEAKTSWDKARQRSAREFVGLCRKIAAITDDEKTKAKKSHIADLWKELGNPNDFTRSAWRVIGTQADALSKHAERLPSAQEAIKELARAEKKQAGSVDELMKTINENSSVGDVRKAVAKILKEPAPNVAASDEHHAALVATKLTEAVATLKDGLTANTSVTVSVSGDEELADALLKAVGKWKDDKSNATRLVIDGEVPHPLAEFERSGKHKRMENLTGVYLDRLMTAERKAVWAFVKKTYADCEKDYRKRVKSARGNLFASAVASSLKKELGWQPEDLEVAVREGGVWLSVSSANTLDNAPEGTSVKAVADTLGERTKGLEAAVKAKVEGIEKPQTLLGLEAEYEKAVKASPNEPYERDALITKLLEGRRKQKRKLSHLKT